MVDEYQSPIPKNAEERIIETYPGGQKMRAEYVLSGEVVGFRFFMETGDVGIEMPIMNGVKHGTEYWWSSGKLDWIQPYVNGLAHGVAKQWSSYDGRLIGTYTMEHGTGIDLWRQEREDGSVYLSEIRYMKDGLWHGFEWWLDTHERVAEEHHFYQNQEHGIERSWNWQGRLRRGYPRYWVHGERVNKAKYLKACEDDPDLPRFKKEDNEPARTFPPEIRQHLRLK